MVAGMPASAAAASPDVMPGNDPEAKPGARQRQSFLAAAPEHKGIAAFEAQNAPLHPGALDQEIVDIGLLCRGSAAALAGKDQLGLLARELQDAWIDQRIVNDVVGRPQRVKRMQGQKPGIAGTRAGKPDLARRKIRKDRGKDRPGEAVSCLPDHDVFFPGTAADSRCRTAHCRGNRAPPARRRR